MSALDFQFELCDLCEEYTVKSDLRVIKVPIGPQDYDYKAACGKCFRETKEEEEKDE